MNRPANEHMESDTHRERKSRGIITCYGLISLAILMLVGCLHAPSLLQIKEQQETTSAELKKERRRALKQAIQKVVKAIVGGNPDAKAKDLSPNSKAWPIDPLIVTLKDEDKYIRGEAADVLGEAKHPKALDPLIATLSDRDEYVRGRAVRALGEIGDARATDPLIAKLKDENSDVRKYAVDALGKLGDTRAIAPLEELAQNEDNAIIRKTAENVLAKLRSK